MSLLGEGGRMNQAYMPKSKSDVHITPDRVWNLIQNEWGHHKDEFFDPCPVNPMWDGLSIGWRKLNYVNPPYSKLKEFVYYGIEQSEYGRTSVFLLPAKTDQEWFHVVLKHNYKIKWIEKRLKFKNNQHHSMQSHFLVEIK
jgi:hypothetical protein